MYANNNSHIDDQLFVGNVAQLTATPGHALTDLLGRLRSLGLDYADETGQNQLAIQAARNLMFVSNPRVSPMSLNLVREFVVVSHRVV
jgi:hypothetical protein